MKEAQAKVKSSARTLEVFEYFCIVGKPQRASEICNALGLASSSGAALLGSLVETGYLIFNKSNKTFSPAIKISTLGDRLGELFAHDILNHLMTELSDMTGEWVSAVALSRDGYRALAFRPGERKYDNPESGRQQALFDFSDGTWKLRSNSSAALLTSRSKVQIVEMVEEYSDILGRGRNCDCHDLVRRVEGARDRRFVYDVRRSPIESIAIPLPHLRCGSPVSISIFGEGLSLRFTDLDELAKRSLDAIDRVFASA